MSDTYRVNGNAVSKASTVLTLDGEPIYGWSEISYDHKRERALVYGAGRDQGPVAKTSGKYTPGAVKLKVRKDTSQNIKAQLAAKAEDGVSYGNPSVPMVLQFLENGVTPMTVEFIDASLTSVSAGEKDGPDASMEDLEFQPLRILENGLSLFDNSEGRW